ncbi:hypothetical protein [Poriferisphaera sp. WC338]|uniref:hypothetical protein n=1 Tax=Poriferisphaera sp. WC338 TaxID=3425129 RepID=UPI003D815A86
MSDFSRYEKMMSSLAGAMVPPTPASESSGSEGSEKEGVEVFGVSVGGVAANVILRPESFEIERLQEGLKWLAKAGEVSARQGYSARFEDGPGFTRRSYHGLVVDLFWQALMTVWENLKQAEQDELLVLATTAAKGFVWAGKYAIEKAIPNGSGEKRTDENGTSFRGPGIDEIVLGAMCLNWIRGEDAQAVYGEMYVGKKVGDVVDILVSRLVDGLGDDGEFRKFDAEGGTSGGGDLLDAWWYRELVCVHGVVNLAIRQKREDWWEAGSKVMGHHLMNTQPDHTTAQPWGVHGFAASMATRIFADQQIHDCEANWRLGPGMGGPLGSHIEGGDSDTSGSVAGLVLANAVGTMREIPGSKIGWSD